MRVFFALYILGGISFPSSKVCFNKDINSEKLLSVHPFFVFKLKNQTKKHNFVYFLQPLNSGFSASLNYLTNASVFPHIPYINVFNHFSKSWTITVVEIIRYCILFGRGRTSLSMPNSGCIILHHPMNVQVILNCVSI